MNRLENSPPALLLAVAFFAAGVLATACVPTASLAAGADAAAAAPADPAWLLNPEDPPLPAGIIPPALAETTDVQHQIGDTTMVLRVAGDTLLIPYFSPRLLEGPHPGVTRAVVSLHGTLRNAHTYLHGMEAAALNVPGADSTALLIAPQFLTEADVAADTLDDRYLYWAYMGWRQGDRSLNTLQHPRPARLSSFAVMDSLLLRLAAACPDLESIVVAGHSAGGQFLNRYAAGAGIHPLLEGTYGLDVRYVVANPSGYLYFDAERWVPGSAYLFDPPSPGELEACPDYDRYKYGLDGLNEYMDQGIETLRAQYATRRVVYLLGGADNDPNNYYLERNCEAMLQGEHRLQRGLIYRQHLLAVFGPSILTLQPFAIVPNAGHDQRAMFNSSCGILYIFDYGTCYSGLPGGSWTDATTVPLRALATRAVAWGDPDEDGAPDLYLSSVNENDALLRNDGASFVDVTPETLRDPQAGTAATWVDADEDGDLDLYAINWRGESRLYQGDGTGGFIEDTQPPLDAAGDLTVAEWADYDRDGDLDLFLGRIGHQANSLLRNDGEYGFVDVTDSLLADTLDTRDVVWTDWDRDGDPDLHIVNSGGPSRLLRNDDGTFVDASTAPLDAAGNGSSACWGDYDNDGDLDVYLVLRGQANRLFRNNGDEYGFLDVTPAPLADAGNGRGALWADFDHDGDLDLYLVNSGARNRLYRNNGDATFTDLSEFPVNDGGMGTGAATADADGDGDLDLYLANDDDWNKLLANQSTAGRHWLQVALAGGPSNTHGLGTWLRISAGGRVQVREVGSDGSATAQNSPVVHFGLGAATTVDTLQVFWPSGIVQTETAFPADRRLTITESTQPARVEELPASGPRKLQRIAPNPFTTMTTITLEAPAGSKVDATIHDATGRRVRTLPATASPAAGQVVLAWDGRDQEGRRLPSGVYFCRVKAGTGVIERRLVLLNSP